MSTQVHRKAIVQDGGRIEVQSDALVPGTFVTVTVTVATDVEPATIPLHEMVGTGTGLFKSVEEIDRFFTEERDAWDS